MVLIRSACTCKTGPAYAADIIKNDSRIPRIIFTRFFVSIYISGNSSDYFSFRCSDDGCSVSAKKVGESPSSSEGNPVLSLIYALSFDTSNLKTNVQSLGWSLYEAHCTAAGRITGTRSRPVVSLQASTLCNIYFAESSITKPGWLRRSSAKWGGEAKNKMLDRAAGMG